jgi:HYR domain
MRRRAWGVVAAAVALGFSSVAAIGASPVAGLTVANASLDMNASLPLVSQLGGCEPVGVATDCGSRTVGGPFPGLGRVTASYSFLFGLGAPLCATALGKALGYPIHLEVAGKGVIDVAVSEAPECIETEAVRTQTQAFTVTGGTGIYAGASGSGTLERVLGAPLADGRHGRETWKGTLTAPGAEFDLVAPRFVGATSRTVVAPRRAKAVRVRFTVTATDDVDGHVPVSCLPSSGSAFPIGRTRVKCSATDTSANRSTATFTVSVRSRR